MFDFMQRFCEGMEPWLWVVFGIWSLFGIWNATAVGVYLRTHGHKGFCSIHSTAHALLLALFSVFVWPFLVFTGPLGWLFSLVGHSDFSEHGLKAWRAHLKMVLSNPLVQLYKGFPLSWSYQRNMFCRRTNRRGQRSQGKAMP